jgi:hypothetical protein
MIQPLRGVPAHRSLCLIRGYWCSKIDLLTRRVRRPLRTRLEEILPRPFLGRKNFIGMCFLSLQNPEPALASRARSGVTMGVKACQMPLLDHRFEVRRRCRELHGT